MLVTIFIATSMVGGGVFGWFAAHTYHTHRARRTYQSAVEAVPTRMLEAELGKRGKITKSAFR